MRKMNVKTRPLDRSRGHKLTESSMKCSILLIVTILIISVTVHFQPVARAASNAGNYIVTEAGASKLSMVTPGGVRTVIYSFAVGTRPMGVAIDGAGNYIVTEHFDPGWAGDDKISKITPGGVRTVIYTYASRTYPCGVAIDGAGNYIVAEYNFGQLSKITPGGVRTVIYSFAVGTHPTFVAIDGAGNYIVTSTFPTQGIDELSKITAGGVRTVIYSFAPLTNPAGVAIDGAGNYIVAEYQLPQILSKITAGGVRTVIYSFGGGSPEGVAIDGAGNYIVTEAGASKLSMVTPGGVRTVIYSFAVGTNPVGVAIVPAAGYSVTIWSWDYIYGWQVPVPITKDGVPTGYSTGHTFTGLTGTHTFTVPSTNSKGHPFSDWDVGGGNIWTDETITVSSAGTYTARYRAGYSVTIWSWCASESQGWMSVPITKDGVPTGYSTGHTFTGLTGTHTFTVPSTDALGHAFYEWNTGWTSRTLTVSSAGVYTARYRAGTLTVTSPNGGEKWIRGTTHQIRWWYTGVVEYVRIELLKSGIVNRVITYSTPNYLFYNWIVPSTQTLGSDYKIRVRSTSNPAISDSSNSNFAIVAGTLTVKSPNGGEKWIRGTTHALTWSSSGSPGAYVKIELMKGGVLNKVIVSSTANDGSYSWTIPSTQTLGTDYKIRITSTTYSSISDSSNSNFAIVIGTLTVTSPNGGESWKRGTVHTITWSKSGSTRSYVKIELLKGGVVNKVIASSTANDGSYSWTIPSTQTAGTDYKIRITSTTYSSISDSSNSNFYITT